MPEPPPRKRFQIHLSTAIVMMFVAGGLLWANLTERVVNAKGRFATLYGWPCDVQLKSPFVTAYEGREAADDVLFLNGGVVVDLVVAAAILSATWFLCERLIRRRAARKDV